LIPLTERFVDQLTERFPRLGLRPAPTTGYVEASFDVLVGAIRAQMEISERMLRRYHVALKTRGFVILSGVSGTGKTWLSELYAQAIGAKFQLVPVAPNWTTNEDLLGYLNPIDGIYHDTLFSQFLRDAAKEYESATAQGHDPTPYHLVLDEMNLARVEYYFAKFLSAMELRARNTTASIDLAPGREVLLTPNLFFVGTVNVDETTHGFADKVYDRAQLLEIELPRDGLSRQMRERPYHDFVLAIWDAVAPVAPFAFRTIKEIERYTEAALAAGAKLDEAVDEQLLQKVLPKLRGSDARLGLALTALIELTAAAHPLTHAKATAMRTTFEQHGFTSFF
jgi:MoxR-like ATPase